MIPQFYLQIELFCSIIVFCNKNNIILFGVQSLLPLLTLFFPSRLFLSSFLVLLCAIVACAYACLVFSFLIACYCLQLPRFGDVMERQL